MAHRGRDPLPHRHEIHELASPPRGWGCHRSGHALKPPGVSGCRSLAGAAVPHPASGSTRPVVAAPLVFTAARPPPAPRREALPPSAARHPRSSDSIPRGIWAALCRRPCQCRLPPARPRKPARGRRTAWHRAGALAGPGAGLPDASRLLLPPPARGHRDHPVRIGHRRPQLLSAALRLSGHLHRGSSPQPPLASRTPDPGLPRLLRLRCRPHRGESGSADDGSLPRSSASPPLPPRLEQRAPITSSNFTATFPRINPPAPSQTEKLLGRKKSSSTRCEWVTQGIRRVNSSERHGVVDADLSKYSIGVKTM